MELSTLVEHWKSLVNKLDKKTLFNIGLIGVLSCGVIYLALDIFIEPEKVRPPIQQANKPKTDKSVKSGGQHNHQDVDVTTSFENGALVETTTITEYEPAPAYVDPQLSPTLNDSYTEELAIIKRIFRKKLELEENKLESELAKIEAEKSKANKESLAAQKWGNMPVMPTQSMMTSSPGGSNPIVTSELIRSSSDKSSRSKRKEDKKELTEDEMNRAFEDISLASSSVENGEVSAWLNYKGSFVKAAVGSVVGYFKVVSIVPGQITILHTKHDITKVMTTSVLAEQPSTPSSSSKRMIRTPPAIDGKS